MELKDQQQKEMEKEKMIMREREEAGRRKEGQKNILGEIEGQNELEIEQEREMEEKQEVIKEAEEEYREREERGKEVSMKKHVVVNVKAKAREVFNRRKERRLEVLKGEREHIERGQQIRREKEERRLEMERKQERARQQEEQDKKQEIEIARQKEMLRLREEERQREEEREEERKKAIKCHLSLIREREKIIQAKKREEMVEEERREILEYKRGELEEEKEDVKEDILPSDKSIRRRAVGWVNKKWEKRNLRKIERTYQREAEEGHKIVHIAIPGHTRLTSTMTRAEREREKRKELLKAEERRKKMEDFNKQWRERSLLKKQTHQQLKEERERMKENYLDQMNLEADAQINTRCLTTQHSHDYNHGQELPGWANGQQVSQEPTGSADGHQERPRRQQAWAENQEGSSENHQGGPENHQGGPDSQQLEAPEEVETSERISKTKKKPSIWKKIRMSILPRAGTR
ncbi:vicilin-like seed storage protein At2g18540 isoform X1 [Oncorhynchus mykiss]|uniref:vicilin-like seed storage protein At2g18540 isoform X1 n=1 Tax=Oncorhynchus mykiss TaxID=8022 RepID=UPI001878ED68|nr:vicilin-like seed storage protein At2g18540 isoform X1 [Oncorhynchus mykiss]